MGKKIKLLIISIMLMFSLIINVNASLVTTTFNPPNIIGGQFIRYSATAYKYTVKIYPSDYVGDKTFTLTQSEGSGMFIGLWHNIVLPDTIYKFSINLDTYDNIVGNTGSLADNNFQFFSIVSQNAFSSLNANSVGVSQEIQGDPISALSTDYYSMFWDKTSKTLSVIFCIPESYYSENISDFQHCYLVTALGNGRSLTLPANITLEAYSGVNIQGAYTNILTEISNKLDMAAGSGLTQEEINEAIQEALTAHDQQLEQEVIGKLDQILEQINGITEPYTEAFHDVMGTLDNFRNIFEYSGFNSNITFPAATNPLAGNAVLWEAKTINLAKAFEDLPYVLKTAIKTILRALVYIAAVREVINIIRYAVLGLKGGAED